MDNIPANSWIIMMFGRHTSIWTYSWFEKSSEKLNRSKRSLSGFLQNETTRTCVYRESGCGFTIEPLGSSATCFRFGGDAVESENRYFDGLTLFGVYPRISETMTQFNIDCQKFNDFPIQQLSWFHHPKTKIFKTTLNIYKLKENHPNTHFKTTRWQEMRVWVVFF